MPIPEIIDVHNPNSPFFADVSKDILDGLSEKEGHKHLPTILLYNERGLRLYDDITTSAEEYYLFNAEEEILRRKADEIVHTMHGGKASAKESEVVLELGAGALRKTSHILLALSRLQQAETPITYYALDLDQNELERTLGELNMSDNIGKQLRGKVDTKGIWGTYDDGLRFVRSGGLSSLSNPSSDSFPETTETKRDRSPDSDTSSDYAPVTPTSTSGLASSELGGNGPPMHLLFLGSSLGNFSRSDGTAFLRGLPLRPGSGDTLLIGLDHDNDKAAIESAYNDRQGYTKRFIMNGLAAAGRALGDEKLFDEDKWEYVNSYNPTLRRHEAFYKSKQVQVITDPKSGIHHRVEAQEKIKVEESFKFSDGDFTRLFSEANLRPIQRWTDSSDSYSLWLLERPPFYFPLLRAPTSASTDGPFGVPTTDDWQTMWACWDFITELMIPSELLHKKPIDLRHICLFYIGHIPTFLDIHLSRLLEEPHTGPENFKYIFERGIDPNVDDPSVCHAHSEVPQNEEDWPSLPELLDFRDRVRQRLLQLYNRLSSKDIALTRKVGRVLHMTYEHEALHAETLLYMLLQSVGMPQSGTVSPRGFTVPQFEHLAEQWKVAPKSAEETVTLGPATVSLGHDDWEEQDADSKSSCQGHEFGWDNEHPKREVQVSKFRLEWRPVTNGDFYTFFQGEHGKAKGIRLPASWVESPDGTVKVRTFFGPVPLDVAADWPVTTDYDSLSAYAIVKGGRLPTEGELRLFMDEFHHGYSGGLSNHGFRNWHPVPANTGLLPRGVGTGKGHNGGVWEWTSTEFDEVPGFESSQLYPGYSKDFFDGCHQVVLGGSYATIPRISERRSFRNWYQKNYPYAFVGGRVAYDA